MHADISAAGRLYPTGFDDMRISRNLRHFRVFLSVAQLHSPTRAADLCRVSQPAVTQAIGKLEREIGALLFDRTPNGLFLTDRGEVFASRIARAMGRLDQAMRDVSPRLELTATVAQLQALIATVETQNFSLAARRLGLAQPTVHRAVTTLEREAQRRLFDRTSFGVVATRACRHLAQAARLAFSEFRQAEADLAEFEGHEVGRIVIGALPLSRSVLLPEAIARFRADRPRQPLTILDGPYPEMLSGVRRGDIDMVIGALRDPAPADDVIQENLFSDRLSILARPGHPLAGASPLPLHALVGQSWAVPGAGTPSRAQFDQVFDAAGMAAPASIVECGSILLMRELLGQSDLLGCISSRQAEAEIRNGLLVKIPTDIHWPKRRIGLTYRADWVPTRAQTLLRDHIRAGAEALSEC